MLPFSGTVRRCKPGAESLSDKQSITDAAKLLKSKFAGPVSPHHPFPR